MGTLALWIWEIRRLVWRLGGIGLIGVGIVDNSLVPIPGSQDFFTIVLSAHYREWWLYYAVMSTIGATIGAYLTYGLGFKGGEEALQQRLKKDRVDKVSATFKKYGFAAVFVPALMPPPIPMVPFVLGAGALKYPLKRFLAAYVSARFIRYTLAAYFAASYGRRVFAVLARHTTLFLTAFCVLAGAALVTLLAIRAWKRAYL